MDKKIIIPIDVYKRIELWLFEDVRYDRNMLNEEFTDIINNYMDSEDYPSKGEPPSDTDFEATTDFALQVTDNIVMDFTDWMNPDFKTPFMQFDIKDISAIWNKRIRNDCPNYMEADNDIYYAVLFFTGIWLKHKATKGMFGLDYSAPMEKAIPNKDKVRPEMLEVYKLFHADKLTNNRTVELRYKGDTLKIKNTDNWFTTMLDYYFKDYLQVNGYEDADRELTDFDPYYTPNKKGRKADVSFLMVTITLYRLLKHLSFSDKGLTNDEGFFILDYLKLLDIIEEGSSKDDILNLRSTINNLLNKHYTPQWWNGIIFI